MRKTLSLFVVGAYLALSNHCGVMSFLSHLSSAPETMSCHGMSGTKEKNPPPSSSKNPCGDTFSCCTDLNQIVVSGLAMEFPTMGFSPATLPAGISLQEPVSSHVSQGQGPPGPRPQDAFLLSRSTRAPPLSV